MSTHWRPLPDILFAELFDGRLEKYGVREGVMAEPENGRYLEGCDGVLLVYREDNGTCTFVRRGCVPCAVFDALTDEFEIEWVSEHDYRYYGFATEEEWDAFHKKLGREAEEEFYNDLIRYLRDEPSDLGPGTIGLIKANIAKSLVASDPGLMTPDKRDVLLEAVEAIYELDHAVKITLSEQDLACVEMMVARTDDLPKA
jgi:hypothetical protein